MWRGTVNCPVAEVSWEGSPYVEVKDVGPVEQGGRGSSWGPYTEPVEKPVLLIDTTEAALHFESSDGLHATPHVPHIVLLELAFQLPPVCLLALSLNHIFSFSFFPVFSCFPVPLIQSLLLIKHLTVLAGTMTKTTTKTQKVMFSVIQSIIKSMSSECYLKYCHCHQVIQHSTQLLVQAMILF